MHVDFARPEQRKCINDEKLLSSGDPRKIVKGTEPTEIQFEMAKPGLAEITVYDRDGKAVRTVKNDLPAGTNSLFLHMSDTASGMYTGVLNIGGKNKKFKIVHIK